MRSWCELHKVEKKYTEEGNYKTKRLTGGFYFRKGPKQIKINKGIKRKISVGLMKFTNMDYDKELRTKKWLAK